MIRPTATPDLIRRVNGQGGPSVTTDLLLPAHIERRMKKEVPKGTERWFREVYGPKHGLRPSWKLKTNFGIVLIMEGLHPGDSSSVDPYKIVPHYDIMWALFRGETADVVRHLAAGRGTSRRDRKAAVVGDVDHWAKANLDIGRYDLR